MATDKTTLEGGLLVRQWAWPMRWAFWCLFIGIAVWAATVSIHWTWALREEPDAPQVHQARLLSKEMALLSRLSPGLFEPQQLAVSIGTGIRDTVVLNAIGFARTLMNWPVAYRRAAARDHGAPEDAAAADPGAELVLQETSADRGTWGLLVSGTYIFAARTSLFLCGLPVLLAGGALGLVDGLVARARRKADAGRESASLYHRAKLSLSAVPITSYLAVLFASSMNAPAVLVPIALVMAVMLRMQVAFYKKYL